MHVRLLEHPNLHLSGNAQHDIASGLVQPDLLEILALLAQHHQISVRMIKTGHPLGPVTPGGRRNDHYFYCAVDIDMVDGQPVQGNETSPGLLAVGQLLTSLAAERRPRLVMGPAAWHRALSDDDIPGFRNDAAANQIHADHLHIGVAEPSPEPDLP